MGKPFRQFLILLLLLTGGLVGRWLGRNSHSTDAPATLSASQKTAKSRAVQGSTRLLKPSSPTLPAPGTSVEIFASRHADEAILRFPTDLSYGNFITDFDSASTQIIDRLDRLRVLRLRFEKWDDLSELLDVQKIVAYNSLSDSPTANPSSETPQPGLVAFASSALDWLGVDTDHSTWGAGVKIAVLDSGIVAHPALPGFTTSIAITPYPADLTQTRGHGTAVASLIAGNDPAASGVAPAAELISVRVTDETGQADAFDLAAGILAAVDAGAHLINCSLGTPVDHPLIEEAVLYARDHGVLIVAAAGNSEQAEATYPAAYPSVISVGSVDARGEHLNFSNFGTYLSLTAPGYEVSTAWPGNAYATLSGTSVSAPLVTGTIAATMSHGKGVTLSATAAAEIVMTQADEAGIPGPDSEYGLGILNVGRVMNRDTPDRLDAAITQQRLAKQAQADGTNDTNLQVTIQNRGTVVLLNTLVDVETPTGTHQFRADLLAPGAIQTFSMPLQLSAWPKDEPIRVRSSLTLGMLGEDLTPGNNQRTDRLRRR